MISPEQYRAVRERAGFVDRTGKGRLLVTGAERRPYLQGLLTNDIAALSEGTGCYAAYLTAQGRMISDMRVFELGDAILLDLEGFVAPSVRDRLSQFIITEDVEIRDWTEQKAQIGVYGPQAAAVVAAFLDAARSPAEDGPSAALLESMPMFASGRWDLRGAPAYVLRSDDLGVAGFDLVVDASQRSDVLELLRARDTVAVDDAVAETTRIEAGRPRFGIDMDETTIPLEAGIEDRAISRTKGCYVGQEVIVRVLDRGHGRVARRLVGLTFADGPAPSRGDAIRSADREIGRVTSSAYSPALDAPVALGYVLRDFTTPGTSVIVNGSAATVATLPFL